MRLDSIYTLESTLPYSMHQMGSLSGAFPLIISVQCYAPTPCWRYLTEKRGCKRGQKSQSIRSQDKPGAVGER